LSPLRRAIAGDGELSPYRFLTRGTRVRVASGPFKDLEGLVESPEHAGRLILQIRALGRAASLEIDACLLQRVEIPDSSARRLAAVGEEGASPGGRPDWGYAPDSVPPARTGACVPIGPRRGAELRPAAAARPRSF
jgi:hypothetical protein